MKLWAFPAALMALQVGAGVVYFQARNYSLGAFYLTCAVSNAALAFLPGAR